MSTFISICDIIASARYILAAQLRILKFIAFSIIHHLFGTDADAKQRMQSSGHSIPKDIHEGKKSSCPKLFQHAFIAPGPHDSRSPCPALNTMANHGYLPRDGRRLTGTILTRALMECYNLSWPLAAFLTWGGILLLGQVGTLTLHDFARHNRVEHDASIIHENASEGEDYAPIHPEAPLLHEFLNDSRYGTYTAEDIARARVRRESVPGMKLSAVQQEIGRGEMALVLQIFGGERRMVSKEMMLRWLYEERLPENWEPELQTSLLGTILVASKIRKAMARIREGMSKIVSTGMRRPSHHYEKGDAMEFIFPKPQRTHSFYSSDDDDEIEPAYVNVGAHP